MRGFPPIHQALIQEYKNGSSFFIVWFIVGILVGCAGGLLPWWVIGAIAVVMTGGLLWDRRGFVWLGCLWGLFFILGLGAWQFRQEQAQTVMLRHPLKNIVISGVVDEVRSTGETAKIVLSRVRFLSTQVRPVPERLELKVWPENQTFSIGDYLVGQATIHPPAHAITPGGYDAYQTLYWQKIGAVGRLEVIQTHLSGSSGWRADIDQIRRRIQERLTNILPDPIARTAIPLTIGDQSVVSPRLYELFRSAGIIHILSVSGFHLSLLAAFIFFLVRGILSFFPTITQYVAAKKVAAVLALVFATAYISISGMQVPAIRSWIMIAIVLVALLTDRNALSVRSLSVAAFLILFFRPELILNIGFQLSFMAVLILVTLYAPLYHWLFPAGPVSVIGRLGRWISGFILVDLLIGMATTPFVIYHFNQYPLYSWLGNVLTGTVLSFWVIPCLFLALILMPFGCDLWLLKGAGSGLGYIMDICAGIEHLPHRLITLPSFAPAALAMMALGIGILCLMKTRWRLPVGGIAFAVGLVWALCSPVPDLWIGDRGQSVAVRAESGKLYFLSRGPSDYTVRHWLLYNGEDPDTDPPVAPHWPKQLVIKNKRIALSSDTCVGADLCLLPEVHPVSHNAIPLYAYDTRFVYITSSGVQVRRFQEEK